MAGCLLAGCTLPDSASQSQPQGVAPPADWTAAMAGRTTADPRGWLGDIQDAALQSAVREAIGKNFSLQAAAARFAQARARAVRDGADRFPAASLTAGADQSWRKTGTAPADPRWQRTEDYSLGLNVSWEADLWGKLRNRAAAAKLEQHAASSDYRAAQLSLAANVAKAWCNLAEAELQVDLTNSTLGTWQKSMETINSSYDRGLEQGDGTRGVTALDVHLARTSLASARADLQARERERDAARRAVEALLGRYPSGKISARHELPRLSRSVSAGLPSTLMLRRPDIAAAEQRLAASEQSLAAAKKELLPSIRLTAGGRGASSDLGALLNEQNLIASLAAGLTQPVFQGGQLKAGVALSQARREELAADYAQTALTAFREVETALAAEQWLDAQIAELEAFEREARRAEELASAHTQTQLDIFSVLESQRRGFEARRSLLRARNARLQNRIDLYLALGGGF